MQERPRGDKAKLGKAFKLADEKGFSFGTYPETSFEKVRQRRADARKLRANGVDPGENRKSLKASKTELTNSFEVIANEWLVKKCQDKSPGSARQLGSVEGHKCRHYRRTGLSALPHQSRGALLSHLIS